MPTLEPEWMAVTPCHRQLEKRIHGMACPMARQVNFVAKSLGDGT